MRGKRADADEGSARPNAADFNFATLRGEIRRVTFHNADNFYTVARVRVAAADVASLPVGATAVPGGGEGSKYGKYKKRGRGAKGWGGPRGGGGGGGGGGKPGGGGNGKGGLNRRIGTVGGSGGCGGGTGASMPAGG